jgi:hypothetical protein
MWDGVDGVAFDGARFFGGQGGGIQFDGQCGVMLAQETGCVVSIALNHG